MTETLTPTPVRLFKQKYADTRQTLRDRPSGAEGFVLEGMVFAGVSLIREFDLTKSMIEVNNKLIDQAREMGATHIFGVEYHIASAGYSNSSSTSIIASGDAYRPTPKKTKE